MSMGFYPVTEPAALYISNELAAYIIHAWNLKCGYTFPDEVKEAIEDGTFHEQAKNGDLPEEYQNIHLAFDILDEENMYACYVSSFTGSVATLDERPVQGDTFDLDFDDDFLVYIPCLWDVSLFEARYDSYDELRSEFIHRFERSDLAEYFQHIIPEDFDWDKHIVTISGIMYC